VKVLNRCIRIGNNVVIMLSCPTLSQVTPKFARQSHAAIGASRNAAFYRVWKDVRLGSIPIARSTFRCLACPYVALGRYLAYRPVPTASVDRMRRSDPSVEFVLDGLIRHRPPPAAGPS
jgi:hypothetical protein